MQQITLLISLLALTLSALTFWLTSVKSGTLKMTKPTVIFFGPDGGDKNRKKIFIRTLLYATSDKGKYIENMFIRLQRGESIQNFNIWVYDNNGLVRGSGLYVDKSGIACNHHFLLPKDATTFEFLSGDYNLQVFVEAVEESPKLIFEQKLHLTANQQVEMLNKSAGTYFDWAPNSQSYFSHVDIRPNKPKELTDLIEILTGDQSPT
jgi:hypothetical protein